MMNLATCEALLLLVKDLAMKGINFKLHDGCELSGLGSMLRSHLEQHASETGIS